MYSPDTLDRGSDLATCSHHDRGLLIQSSVELTLHVNFQAGSVGWRRVHKGRLCVPDGRIGREVAQNRRPADAWLDVRSAMPQS